MFDSDEINKIISELIDAANTISKKEPTIGFHHKFYVPGWIGGIQIWCVERKMSAFEKTVFYKDKNYLDFANWIIDSSKKLADLHTKNIETDDSKDKERTRQQSNAIIYILAEITNAWYNCAPEVASICNRKYTKNTMISLAGIVRFAVEDNLKPIGCPQSPRNHEQSFKEDLKDIRDIVLTYICNLILLSLILGLGRLIFG